MKLNIGSGEPRGQYKKADWINVDLNKMRGVNLRGDLKCLPLIDHSVDVIHLIHVFEHITRPEQLTVLRELHRVLKPGGELFIEVPDFKRTIAYLVAGWNKNTEDGLRLAHNMTASLYGKQRYPGDQHCWAFTSETLEEFLVGAAEWASIEHLNTKNQMVSTHWQQEPVLLIRAIR